MNKNHYCLIMAGGYSNKFWPISRDNRPKQFLELPALEESFIKTTYKRCAEIVPKENILVVALSKHENLVREELPELPEHNLLSEPYGRHTAPCIVYATLTILKRNPKAIVAVTPSDLVISGKELYKETMLKALQYAEENNVLMTLGITPTHPDPGFGYIQIAGGKDSLKKGGPVKVKTFTEKPDLEIAKAFCNSGEFFWNSGIFIWKASVIYSEMMKYIPEVMNLFTGWETAIGSSAEKIFIERAYVDCNNLSIDYGVMEKTDIAWLYPAKFGWIDMDNWKVLYDIIEKKDDCGNAIHVEKYFLQNSQNNICYSDKKKKLIAVQGLSDYLVIDTDDVLLICPKDDKKYRDFVSRTRTPDLEEFK